MLRCLMAFKNLMNLEILQLASLCQYSADDGHMMNWHMSHLREIIIQSQKIDIQLTHAECKMSSLTLFLTVTEVITEHANDWLNNVKRLSNIPFLNELTKLKAMMEQNIEKMKKT
ncbi:NADH-dependent flavin oxidoreductase [Blastomyces gilchristii SLH14081]|uniref:NADH-dependent flavin oxidoreductase n=1 Tax=Blastomyces gilchristii (strain SLH14081) TaxID=559298 RepID=A0A179UK03_BLAGS|nr:NADH-dependent flavin oxidoreductase [Blastomyces gilchristii SLH14081]OAT07361.1 NADH-dependent flavin oxidoreductase [Blastomyces gilchristii SLH14081]